VSVLDVGHQLARALVDVERTGRGQISTSDDDIVVSFALEGGDVMITTNRFASRLNVSADEFRSVCQRFLSEIAGSLHAKAPALLAWQSLAQIAAWAPS
jgi:hypothetical protein